MLVFLQQIWLQVQYGGCGHETCLVEYQWIKPINWIKS